VNNTILYAFKLIFKLTIERKQPHGLSIQFVTQPTEAVTEQQNGEKEEPEPKRSRRNEAGGGNAEEPEPKRSRRNEAAPQGSDQEEEIQPGPSNTQTEE
jgi:hypothetical protein